MIKELLSIAWTSLGKRIRRVGIKEYEVVASCVGEINGRTFYQSMTFTYRSRRKYTFGRLIHEATRIGLTSLPEAKNFVVMFIDQHQINTWQGEEK